MFPQERFGLGRYRLTVLEGRCAHDGVGSAAASSSVSVERVPGQGDEALEYCYQARFIAHVPSRSIPTCPPPFVPEVPSRFVLDMPSADGGP